MADVFSKDDVKVLLNRKYVLFIGDSNVRSLYKDLLWLVSCDGLTTSYRFSRKLGNSFLEDNVLNNEGNEYSWHFTEHRSYNKDFRIDLLHMSILKINRIESFVNDVKEGIVPEPDVVVFSSFCPKRSFAFLEDVLYKLKHQLPKQTLFLMAKALPMVVDSFGDPMIEEIMYFKSGRLDTSVTDYCEMANRLGFIGVDPLYYTQLDIFRGFDSRRDRKGLRFLTNLILTKYAIHLNQKLPGRVNNLVLRQAQLSSLACIKEYRNLERRISNGSCFPQNDPALINATQFLRVLKSKRNLFFRTETNRKRKATSKQLEVKLRRIDKSPTELMEIGSGNQDVSPHENLNVNVNGKKNVGSKRKIENSDIKKMCSYRGGVIKSVVFPSVTTRSEGPSNQELFVNNKNKSNVGRITSVKVSYNTNRIMEMPARNSLCQHPTPSPELSLSGQTKLNKTFSSTVPYDGTISSVPDAKECKNQPSKLHPSFQINVSGSIKTSNSSKECTPQNFSNPPDNQNFMNWLTKNFSQDLKTDNQEPGLNSNNNKVVGESKRDSLPPITQEHPAKRCGSKPNSEEQIQIQVGPNKCEERSEIHPRGRVRDEGPLPTYQHPQSVNKAELLNMSKFLLDLREKLNVNGTQPPTVPSIIAAQQTNNFKTFSFRAIPPLRKFNKSVGEKCVNPFQIENVSWKSLSVQPKPAYKNWMLRNSKNAYSSNWQHVRGDGYCRQWSSTYQKRPNEMIFDMFRYPKTF